jgi:hypothetical protein
MVAGAVVIGRQKLLGYAGDNGKRELRDHSQ